LSKAAVRKNTADILKQQKQDRKRFFAARRQEASGTGNNQYGNTTVNNPSGFSITGGNLNVEFGVGNPLQGGNFTGPIAFNNIEKAISSGKLTVATYYETPTSYVIVNGEGGSADDLVYIISKNVDLSGNASGDQGADFSGQFLLLQAGDANITLKHNTGNIFMPGGSDLTLNKYDSTANTGGGFAILLWDNTNIGTSSGKWVLVSSGSGGGSFDPSAIAEDLVPATTSTYKLGGPTKTFDGVYADEIHLITEGATTTNYPTISFGNNARGMTFTMPYQEASGTRWTWQETGTAKMTLSNSGMLTMAHLNATSTLYSQGTATFNTLAEFNGDVRLGNSSSDDITFNGKVDSDIKVTGNCDLGDSGTYWHYGYIFNGRFNNIEIDGTNAELNMKNNEIVECGDIKFDGTESIFVNSTEVIQFQTGGMYTKNVPLNIEGGDLQLNSTYIRFGSYSQTGLSGTSDGYVFAKTAAGWIKIPYYT